jgi:hypothetical protein
MHTAKEKKTQILNVDNLNNVRHEASRHFRNEKREYLKYEMKEFAMNSKKKSIGDQYIGINEVRRDYQPRNNLVRDDLLADCHNILNRWKNYSQLLNVHNVSDVRQIESHTPHPLVPGPSCCEVRIAIADLMKYKWPGNDQILAEQIQAGSENITVSNPQIH